MVQTYNDLSPTITAHPQTALLTSSMGGLWMNCPSGMASVFISSHPIPWRLANKPCQRTVGIPLTFPVFCYVANIGNTSWEGNLIWRPKTQPPAPFKRHQTAAFAHPVNQYGDSGRGIVASTPFSNFDFSLMKISLYGKGSICNSRAEFNQNFNIQNYGLPGTTFGGPNFGVVSNLVSGAIPRQIQFSLRVEF